MRTVLTFPYLDVYLHAGTVAVLETHWLGYASGSEFRAAIEQTLQLGFQHQVKGWIADDRLLGAVRPRDLQWTYDEVLTALDRLGLQRFALLESHDSLNRLTIATIYQEASTSLRFEIQRFEDIKLARVWAISKG